jgi:hypothetical protein
VVCNIAINTKNVYYQREFERAKCNDTQHIFCSRVCLEQVNGDCPLCEDRRGRGRYWPFCCVCCCFIVAASSISLVAWLMWPTTVD